MKSLRIALAGGPGTGKTSSTRAIRALAESRGLPFYEYREVATDLMAAGKTPKTLGAYEFQRLVLRQELENEAEGQRSVAAGGVAVFDRGSPDAWVYLGDAEGDRLAGEFGVTKDQLFEHFDLCLFFGENPGEDGSDIKRGNQYRVEESPEEILSLADRSYAVWHEHPDCVDLQWTDTPDGKPKLAAEAVAKRL